jgi:hypothetical protein
VQFYPLTLTLSPGGARESIVFIDALIGSESQKAPSPLCGRGMGERVERIQKKSVFICHGSLKGSFCLAKLTRLMLNESAV